jgi:hypothetical protein
MAFPCNPPLSTILEGASNHTHVHRTVGQFAAALGFERNASAISHASAKASARINARAAAAGPAACILPHALPRRSVEDVPYQGRCPTLHAADLSGHLGRAGALAGSHSGHAPLSQLALIPLVPDPDFAVEHRVGITSLFAGSHALCLRPVITAEQAAILAASSPTAQAAADDGGSAPPGPGAPTRRRKQRAYEREGWTRALFKAAHDPATPCPGCGHAPFGTAHVLFDCEHPRVRAAQEAMAASAPRLIERIARLALMACLPTPPRAGSRTGQGAAGAPAHLYEIARGRAEAIGARARAAIPIASWRSQADARYALYRLLTAVPWPAASVALTPPDISCALSASLGRLFDETAVPRYRVRTLATAWTRWAAHYALHITGAWVGTIGASTLAPRLGPGSSDGSESDGDVQLDDDDFAGSDSSS